MLIRILSENRTSHSECLAEHGLSVYIETGEMTLLFDVGASDLFKENAEKLNTDLNQVDAVVISHGHYDHTGGLPIFCDINKHACVYIHKTAFQPAFGMENGTLEDESCGIRWSETQRENLKPRLNLTEGPCWLTEDIVISGTIPKTEDFTPTEQFYIRSQSGELITDDMAHEQFLGIRVRDEKSKGIFLFSGCSHTGVIPLISYAKSLFPGERIFGLLAGMHLYHTEKDELERILDQIAAEEMAYVMPVHCTGMEGICGLMQRMGSRCLPVGVGDSISF